MLLIRVVSKVAMFSSIFAMLTGSGVYANERYIDRNLLLTQSKVCPIGQRFDRFFNTCVTDEKPIPTSGLSRGMLQICNLTMGIYGQCPCIVQKSIDAGFTATQFIHLVGREDQKTTPQQQMTFDQIRHTCLGKSQLDPGLSQAPVATIPTHPIPSINSFSKNRDGFYVSNSRYNRQRTVIEVKGNQYRYLDGPWYSTKGLAFINEKAVFDGVSYYEKVDHYNHIR